MIIENDGIKGFLNRRIYWPCRIFDDLVSLGAGGEDENCKPESHGNTERVG